MTFGARAVIRLGALSHNLNRVRGRVPGSPVMAVVKANAYGHGLEAAAGALIDADSFGVARLGEALRLREAGITKPIVLMSGVHHTEELGAALAAGLELVVHTEHQVALLETADTNGAVVWLKVDTGMRRLGFAVEDVASLAERLRACPAVRELRLMSHFASADRRDEDTTPQQIAAFRSVADRFEGDISLANSPAVFGWTGQVNEVSEARPAGTTWVRTGLCLYGISPFAEGCGEELGLEPAMDFEARLIAVKPIRAGDSVGYGGTWTAPGDTTLGLVSAGYGDGYLRFLPSGTPVLVNGRRASLAGVISMDIAAVDLGGDARDRVGDRVLLWGSELPVEEVARCAGTIPYQLVCAVNDRVERLVVEG